MTAVHRPGAGLRPRHPEDAHQAALLAWAHVATGMHPDLAFLVHVPNGGKRGKLEACRLKRQGVKRGYPDLLLDVARGGYHGLRIELKATRGDLGRAPVVSPEQSAWIRRLREQGYCALVCEGWEAARDALLIYLAS